MFVEEEAPVAVEEPSVFVEHVTILDPYDCGDEEIVGAVGSSDLSATELSVEITCGDQVTTRQPSLTEDGNYSIIISYDETSSDYVGMGECSVDATASINGEVDTHSYTIDLSLDCGCGDGRIMGEEVCEVSTDCQDGFICESCGCIEIEIEAQEILPYSEPSFWPGM